MRPLGSNQIAALELLLEHGGWPRGWSVILDSLVKRGLVDHTNRRYTINEAGCRAWVDLGNDPTRFNKLRPLYPDEFAAYDERRRAAAVAVREGQKRDEDERFLKKLVADAERAVLTAIREDKPLELADAIEAMARADRMLEVFDNAPS